jgi:DNA-directed RNA polymerase II subunit RPB1
MSHLPRSSETEAIVGIQFGVFSPEEIVRRSVCEITNPSTAEGKLNGLFDPRMGVLENGKVCRSCGQNNHHCPGHFGHFTLARPVYYTQFFKLVMKILRCVCFKCGKLLIDKSSHSHFLKLKGETRWKVVYEACSGKTRCGEDTEDGCGSRQPSKYKEEPVHKIYAEFKGLEIPAGMERPEGFDKDTNTLTMPLEPEYVHRLLRRITDEDVEFMGFSRHWCRPDWMMCSVLPIPPPQVRPSVTQDNNQRAEDDLTSKLLDIIKANNTLKKKISEDPKKKAIDEWTNLLQYHVATLVDNKIPGISPAAQRSGRQLKSVQQRLGSKEGRIRSNLQGKRVEWSARSVITPDPNISVKELGVPMKIAMNLTFPEKVTAFNIGKLYKLIQNGPDTYPGAKTIVRAESGRTISLKHVNTKTIELFEGDTVNRHLMDGDVVLFNRQPSLHRMSMMAHIAKILPYNTFRLNVFVTAPYNADFDGDEMNLHAPQSVEAATELRMIAAVPLQIVSPRESAPIVSVVQDTLVGANRFTRDGILFTKSEAMALLIHAKRWDGKLPAPLMADPVSGTPLLQPMWSGRQLLSALLPPVSLKMKNKSEQEVEIAHGMLQKGTLDKDVFGKALLHIVYNDYGPDMTVDFLDSLQAMIANFLMNSGFSVGISDLIADKETNDQINVALSKLTKTIEDQILQLHTGLFENSSGRSNQEEFEAKLMSTLNKAVDEAGKIGLASLADTNRMTNMIKAGSKGSNVNVSQMVATLGQQAIEGKRVPNGFQHRTLPHFKRFDDSATARGFISSSYIKGLQPDEFFFHAMTGREGLIDTAVKTADTGYMQRQIRVALEDLITQHDGSVRDATGNIVQIAYGEDGANATKLEGQGLPIGEFSDEKLAAEYAAEGSANAGTYLAAAKADRALVVEKLFMGKPQKSVRYPVHLERLLYATKYAFNLTGEGTVTAQEVLEAQNTILNRTHEYNKLWGALVRWHMRPVHLRKLGYTKVALDAFTQQAILKHWQSWVEPGQPVGVIAAQSIGEPATQMTLNTFHLAGVAAKSNMTRGVPRLKELLKATKKPKATEVTIPLRTDLRSKKEEARRVARELEFTLLQDIVTTASIYYDPRDNATLIAEDADWLAYLAAFETTEPAAAADAAPQPADALAAGATSDAEEAAPEASKKSPLILRFELDRERMFAKDITMDDIAFILKKKFSSAIETLYTDYNSNRLVFRVRLVGGTTIDDLTVLQGLQNRILSNTAVKGIPGLRAVNYTKTSDVFEFTGTDYKPVEQYVLISDGSNFLEILAHPDVDATKIVSSDIHDMMNNLGIEATRATLYKEIDTLFKESGSSVNYRHVGLLLDKMCHRGRVMSVDRYGINKNDIGPLAKMSFEQTEDIALRAAMFGERDPALGVSASVMLGAPIRAGTAFSEILFDEAAAVTLGMPDQLVSVNRGFGTMTEGEIDEMLGEDEDDDGDCAPRNLHMKVPMPIPEEGEIHEEMDDDLEITEID